jgi:hypothetical protein
MPNKNDIEDLLRNVNKTRTLQDSTNYSFNKGMNQDTPIDSQPKDTYRAALNMVRESSEGDENYLTSEYSNTFRITLPGKVLHSNLIKSIDKVVLFLDTNEIGIYDPNANTYTKLYASPDLNFTIYLESVSFTKTECEDIVLIFWDNLNRVRNINVSKFLKNGPGSGPVEELELFKTADTCIKLSNVSFTENAAYNVDAGVYRPFIQYEDEDGNTTNYYIINENIPLIEDYITGSFQYIDGNEPKKLNKSIVLHFDSIDTKYPYINIGFIKTVGGVSTAFKFKSRQPVKPSLTINYEGDTIFDTTIDLQEVLNKRAFYLSANSGLIYNNRLLLGGVKGIKNVDYQHYANNITVKYVTGKINLTSTKGYKNPEHVIHHKSWMRDENYMLGIVLEFEDMSESAVFPLVNTKYPDFPEFTGPEGERPETNDTNLCCNTERKYWKEVNTAKRTYYNPNAVDLSVLDYCSGSIDNNENTIRSEGYLGYFESEERYPVIPRCNVTPGSLNPNDYMYPTEVINGVVVGKNITLFKMPDSTIEPFHNNLLENYSVNSYINTYKSRYEDLEIYPLGLKLDNVIMPTLTETGGVKVTGYRLVYVRRDSYNKSIQDKGWFVEMFKNNLNGQDFIYPKHNVNSAAKWDYFSNIRNRDIEGSNPIHDFVSNCGYGTHYNKGMMFYGGNTLSYQQGLNINHVKIEQQYNTLGFYIDSIRHQNSDRYSTWGDDTYDPSTFLDKDGRFRASAIQIYNLYNYGYNQLTNGSIDKSQGYFNRTENIYQFKNICIDNYSYVKDNVILNKILGAEYSLVNYYRESGLFLDFKNTTDLSFNKAYKNYTFECTINSTTIVNIPNTTLPPGTIITLTDFGYGCLPEDSAVFGPIGRQYTVINSTTLEVIGTPFDPSKIGTICDYLTFSAPSNREYFNSDTSSKKCTCVLTPEYYYDHYLDNASTTRILDQCNEGYIYYGSIKNNLPSQYGSINDMFFIDTGLKACANQTSVTGFYGDSYINTFSFIRTGVTGMLEDSAINDSNTVWADKYEPKYTITNIIGRGNSSYLLNLFLPQKANVTLLNTIIESDVNLDLRYEGPTYNELYYPKLANGKYKLYSTRKYEYAEDCFLNTYFYELYCNNAQDNCTSTSYEFVEYNDSYKNFHNNVIHLNTDYNELNGMRYYLMKPINSTYKVCDCNNEYDNRIIISSADNQSVGRLNYSKFLKNDFITLPHKEGKLTKLLKESQILYAHTTDNIWKLLTLESKLQANNNLVYLGTNDFLSAQQLELFASSEGYAGLQDKRFSFQNNVGYFFIDLKNQTMNLFSNNQLDSISTYGMNSFFKTYLKPYYNSYSQKLPLSNIQLRFSYDYRHKRLLFTDVLNEYTISYYPEYKAFYSYHSYLPAAYIQNRDTFFSQDNNNDLYIHEDNFNSYRKFYGQHYPSIVDSVFTYFPMNYTTLQNIGIKMDVYNNVNDQLILVDEPPTSVSVWTNRQHSGEVFLKTPVNIDYMSNVVLDNQPHNIINGMVFCNNLMNYVVDSSQNFLQGSIFKYPNTNVSFAKDWTKVDRLENGFFNYRININNKDLENLKFILKFTLLNYNISMR